MNKRVGILDEVTEYGQRLTNAINTRKGIALSASFFPNPLGIKEKIAADELQILLVSERYAWQVEDATVPVYILTSQENTAKDSKERVIPRYSRVSEIVDFLLSEVEEKKKINEDIYAVREKVIQELPYDTDISEEELYEKIDSSVMAMAKDRDMPIEELEEVRNAVFNAIRGLDILEEVLADDSVTEIMINGADNIFLERKGKIEVWNKSFESDDKLKDIIQRIVGAANRMVNEASPIVDARLPDGSRVNVILPPIAIDGPTVTIRKFSKEPITMEKMVESGTITEEAALFLQELVKSRYNILISGGTGSGKTTFLNALSAYIPKDERIITIEDSAELQIRNVRNLVRLECRNKSSDEVKEVSVRDLIRASLRMRPDRIIVGEVRGSEVIDMLSAMNTGHDGSLSSAHGNSIPDMLERLATMTLMGLNIPMNAVKQQIASALDIMIHVARFSDGSRKVVEIAEITGMQEGEIRVNPLFVLDKGKLVATENKLSNRDKLTRHGGKLPEGREDETD